MRFSTLLRLVALLGMVVLGCGSMLGLDDYESAPERLCELSVKCSTECASGDSLCRQGLLAECLARVDQSLGQAESADRSAWLEQFVRGRCGQQCTGARRCLDFPPVCEGTFDACARDDHCCGFLKGKAGCDGNPGQCCISAGVACTDDGQCCGGLPCVRQAGETKTCGGTVCFDEGELCQENAQCCTNRCVLGVCALEICSGLGFECQDDKCCPGLECQAGKCGVPECLGQRAPCDPDASQSACCDGTECKRVLPDDPLGKQLAGLCLEVVEQCLPVDVPCDRLNDGLGCCDGLACAAATKTCSAVCTLDDAFCTNDQECCSKFCDSATNKCGSCTTGFCLSDADCCTLNCVRSSGATQGTCGFGCKAPSCHSVKSVGPPLGSKLDTDITPICTDPPTVACILAICALDPYCCCSAWDQTCVSKAENHASCSQLP